MDIVSKYENKKFLITSFCLIGFTLVLIWNVILMGQSIQSISKLNLSKISYIMIDLLPYIKPIFASAIAYFAINFIGHAICDHIIQMAMINNNLDIK